MIAHVYRSERKQDTYLYLRELDAFSLAPEAIVKTLQPLNFSFSFELTPDRKLARGDAAWMEPQKMLRNAERRKWMKDFISSFWLLALRLHALKGPATVRLLHEIVSHCRGL